MSHKNSLDNTLQDQGDVDIVKEQLFIRGLENSRAQIFNSTGACVGAYDIKSEQEILNVNHLSVGLYIIQIKINNHTNYFKIIKTKD